VHGSDATGTVINGGCCVINCTNNDEIYGMHTGGCNILRADGSVTFMAESTSAAALAAMISRAGGEVVSGN